MFPDTAHPLLCLLNKQDLTMSHCLELHFPPMTNIYCLSSKGQFWNNYTSRGENVSQVLDWRFGGTILSGSFFITQGDSSGKGRRIVILKTPGSKTHFAKNQFKSKNDGQVSQTSRKIYLPKYKKPYYQVVKLHVKMQYSWLEVILDHWGGYRIVRWVRITEVIIE